MPGRKPVNLPDRRYGKRASGPRKQEGRRAPPACRHQRPTRPRRPAAQYQGHLTDGPGMGKCGRITRGRGRDAVLRDCRYVWEVRGQINAQAVGDGPEYARPGLAGLQGLCESRQTWSHLPGRRITGHCDRAAVRRALHVSRLTRIWSGAGSWRRIFTLASSSRW